jgi:hypothetical protein
VLTNYLIIYDGVHSSIVPLYCALNIMCDPTIGASGNIKSKGKIDVSIT